MTTRPPWPPTGAGPPPRGLRVPARRARQGGFSLIELLTTLTVFMMIAVLYTTVVDNISHSVTRSARRLDASAALRTLHTALSRDLHRLAPSAANRPSCRFERTPEETHLWLSLRPGPAHEAGRGAKSVEISYQWQSATGQLRRFDPALGAPHSPSNPGTLIASGLTGLSVAWDRSQPNAPALRLVLEFPAAAVPPGMPRPDSWPMELLLPVPVH